MQMNVYYISIEGNTKHFVTKMARLFHNVSLHEITDQDDLFKIKSPFFCFVPTYVIQHGNGPQTTYEETDTLTMHDLLDYQHNSDHCIGVIGSGNRNFGVDCYAITARRYHQQYGMPLLATYEIRGTMDDENTINHRMVNAWNHATGQHLIFKKHDPVNPRLAKLKAKYKNF